MMENRKAILVLVPGMFSPGIVFDNMKNLFEETGRKCIVSDFPEHSNFYGKVNCLLKIIKKIKGEYELVGHSAGAAIVLKVASIKSVRAKNIFLIAPAAPYGIFHLYPSVVKSFWCIMRDPQFMTKVVKMPYENVRWAMLNTLAEEDAKKIYKTLRGESGKFIFEVGFWFLDSKKSTLVDYQKITCPIDVFIGTEDRVTPLKVSRNIIKRIKLIDSVEGNLSREIRLHEFSGLSHWLLLEACNEIVLWINGV